MRTATTSALVFLLFVSAVAQEVQQDWNAVKALDADTTVRIQLEERQIEGRLVSVDDAVITIAVEGTTLSLERQSIQQIDRVGRQVGKHAGLGFVIGLAGGAVLGYSTAETNRGAWTALMAAGWGAIGALIGAADGMRKHDYRLVYRTALPPSRGW